MLMLAVCLVFAPLGFWMIRHGQRWGYLLEGVFALGVPIFALQFHPRASYLRLEPAGFTLCILFQTETIPWWSVAEFGVMQSGLAPPMVAWNYVPEYSPSRRGGTFTKSVTGFEAGLPDTYGMNIHDLMKLMESWRVNFGGIPYQR